MCGIAGILRRRDRDPSDASRIVTMTDRLVHRGPDDVGYLHLDGVSLGSRRLAIVDLSAQGRQPLANEDGTVFAVHNGEIYNHVELRAILEGRGHVFRSRTDTEVIVHAWEEWGEACVERFIGMWAFAVWDQRRRELFCSRDRFGVKPFYYHLDDDLFVFASEIKAILPALPSRAEPNLGVVAEYLLERTTCRSSETFFAGIERLEPAHNLLVSAGSARKTRYWSYPTAPVPGESDQAAIDEFRDLFRDAVRLRLRSDVPVGVALSGGLDSTAILTEAAALSGGQPLHVFTAIFPGDPFDEHDYAHIAARHCGAELHTVVYSPDRLLPDLESLIWHLDSPGLLPQVLPRWALMRLASAHVKVILEGQGADEILAGYASYYLRPYVRDQLARLRTSERIDALADLGATAAALYRTRGLAGYGVVLRREAKRFRRPRYDVYRSELLELRRAPRLETPATTVFSDRVTAAMHDDHSRAQLPMLLHFGDAISMAHSLESRLPFLDHRLVELAFRLPVQHKFHRGRSKVILRQAMAGRIPDRIESRRDKVGFEAPIARWMRQRLASDVRPVLLSDRTASRGLFDMRRLGEFLTPDALSRPNVGWQVFLWLSLELWYRAFVDGEAAPASASRPARFAGNEVMTVGASA